MIMEFCRLDHVSNHALAGAVEKLSLSSRACHSILRIARTIADLAGEQDIGKEHILEAVQHRRFGEDDSFWNYG